VADAYFSGIIVMATWPSGADRRFSPVCAKINLAKKVLRLTLQIRAHMGIMKEKRAESMNHFRTCFWLLFTIAASSGCQEAAGPSVLSRPDEAPPAPLKSAFRQSCGPLEITFWQSCGPPAGGQRVYDPKTGVFHIHFSEPEHIGSLCSGVYKRSGFEVTKVTGPFVKPVVFRLTGVPASYGCLGDPLALCVGEAFSDFLPDGKIYDLVADPLAAGPVDQTLFRVKHDVDAITIEFREKGRALLKPGTVMSFKLDHAW
jgi:hypothetical protein